MNRKAVKIYEKVLQAMHTKKITILGADDDELTVDVLVSDKRGPVAMTLNVDAERELIILYSAISLMVPQRNSSDFAFAVSLLNGSLTDGSFDYDIDTGEVVYRLTSSLRCGRGLDKLVYYMLARAYHIVGILKIPIKNLAEGELSLSGFREIMKTTKREEERIYLPPGRIMRAQEIFSDLRNLIKSMGWRSKEHDDNLTVWFDVLGDDVPMSFSAQINAKEQLVIITSPLPILFRPKKETEAAVAASAVSNLLIDGAFGYDTENKNVVFRMTSLYCDSGVTEDLLKYMIMCAISTVETFNDRFLAINKGMLTLKRFLKELN